METNQPVTWTEQLRRRMPWRRTRGDNAGADYVDRISVVTWVLVLGFGLSLLIKLPTTVVSFRALGSPTSIEFSASTLTAIALAVVAAAGTESIIRLHPLRNTNRLGFSWTFWALPAAISIITVVLLPQIPTQLLQVVVMLAAGGLLALAFFGLYATVVSGQVGYRRARLWLDALAYGSALLLFLFIYQSRTRSLLSGTVVSLTSILLAIEVLRTSTDRMQLVLVYSVVVGLILGEITWALNYWPLLPGLTGGLLLLLSFYLSVGIALQGLQGRLTRRVLIEFALFGIIALILIIVFGPGF